MSCETVRARLFEASATALAGRGESAVARHIRGCAPCHAVASRILEETARLEGDLEGLQPGMSEEEAVRMALKGRATGARRPRSPRSGRRWARWAPVPLAAAAAMAALVFTAGPRGERLERVGPPDRTMTEATPVEAPPPRLSVDIPEGSRVAVFETTDPSITVVWFY